MVGVSRALVTGGTGHIGSHVARELVRQKVPVRVLARPASDRRAITGLDIEVVEGDVLDAEAVQRAMTGCSVVYHAAALYSTDPARAEEIREVASRGTRNVFTAARRAGVDRVVHTSSVAAIGHNYDPNRELDESVWNDAPMDAYCEAKTQSERLAWALAQQENVPTVVVNPATVLGANDWRTTPSNLLVLQYLQHPRPVYFSGGHSYVDVEDVARGHVLAAAKGTPGERYILGGENITLREVFESLSSMTGLSRPRVLLGQGTLRLAASLLEAKAKLAGSRPLLTREKADKIHGYYSYFSSAKAQRELGYTFLPAGDVVARAVAWYVRTPGFLEARRVKQIEVVLSRVHPELLGVHR